MNNYDNGYTKAQREYDNQTPPEPDEMQDCPLCEGTGKADYSNCCGWPIIMHDICSKCKEHCELDTCAECDGNKEINLTAKAAEARREYMEAKAEERWEEQRQDRLDPSSDRYTGMDELKDNE